MNKSSDLFLHCNNLTLDQYKLITFSRGLTGAVGLTVSLVVLVVILLAARKKAWDTLPKRLFFVAILSSALLGVVVTAGVHYSHPPTQESAWCEAMGFFLLYSGVLVVVSYLVLDAALALQVFMSVCLALKEKMEQTFSNRMLWEVILFLGSALFPILITWEPFIAPLATYGNYGPICWFRLEIYENCTYKNDVLLSKDKRFLWILPIGIMSFLVWALTLTITIVLCCMYCKFKKTKTADGIEKGFGQALLPTAALLLWVAWLSLFLFQTFKPSKNFSSWIVNVTLTPTTMAGVVVLVALYIHFPVQWLYSCCKRRVLRPQQNTQQTHDITERPTTPLSEWDHRNVPSFTQTNLSHETVTGSGTSLLINEQPGYQTFTNQPT